MIRLNGVKVSLHQSVTVGHGHSEVLLLDTKMSSVPSGYHCAVNHPKNAVIIKLRHVFLNGAYV